MPSLESGVKTPLLEVLEKRRAAEQAERDRKKKEQEAAATAAAAAAAAASAKESSNSASATTTTASGTVVPDRPPVLQGSQSDSLPAFGEFAFLPWWPHVCPTHTSWSKSRGDQQAQTPQLTRIGGA